MPVNKFFDNFESRSEQKLYDDILIEMIRTVGLNVFYMPRTHVNIDRVFVQDPLSRFDEAIQIEMYLENFLGWQGQGDMMTKFGITMADQVTLSLSKTRFNEDIGIPYDMIRPLEGDLVYIPMTHALFEIKFVEHEDIFYQTGKLNYYQLKCERFIYNSEDIDTGIPDIDAIGPDYTESSDGFHLLTSWSKYLLTGEGARLLEAEYGLENTIPNSQNQIFNDEANNFVIWSENNPFSEKVL